MIESPEEEVQRLALNYPDVTHFVWLVANTRDGNGPFLPPPATVYAWHGSDREGAMHCSDRGGPIRDYNPAGALAGAIRASGSIPPGSRVHFLSDINSFTAEVNRPRETRKARDYMNSKGKPMG